MGVRAAMITARHRTASGNLNAQAWELRGRSVVLTLRVGARLVEIDVPVASPKRRRFGAWQLVRTDEHSWQILPAKFVGEHSVVSCAVHEHVGFEGVALTCAPDDVSLAMSEL